MKNKYLLVITAEHYSGKTTLQRIAKNMLGNDCISYSAREIIEHNLKQQQKEIHRTTIRDEGQRLSTIRSSENYDAISSSFMTAIKKCDHNALHVIDSCYHPFQIINWRKWCQENGYVYLEVAIICSFEKRLELAHLKIPALSENDLRVLDQLERTGKIGEQQIDTCMDMVACKLYNESTYDNYVEQIITFLSLVLK